MRIVVTGGSGKAGRAVVRDLLEHGAGALVVHAEEEQSLCADRGHPAVLPGWRCKEDEPLDLGMLGSNMQRLPTVF